LIRGKKIAQTLWALCRKALERRVTGLGKFSLNGRLFSLGSFVKITERVQVFWVIFFHGKINVFILSKNRLGNSLCDFVTNSSGHPACTSNRKFIQMNVWQPDFQIGQIFANLGDT
jgi:hypothetical protein